MIRRTNILIIVSIFLLYTGLICLYAQEKETPREEARQHYRQGQEFYSQGLYQEATAEFDTAITLLTPAEMQFEEKIQKVQGKVLAPAPALPKVTPPKKKLIEKKKEEKEAEVTKGVAAEKQLKQETERKAREEEAARQKEERQKEIAQAKEQREAQAKARQEPRHNWMGLEPGRR